MKEVFIVEDNAAIRDAVAGYLRLEDFQVKEFPGISGVLEALRFREPLCIVLDVMLTDGNGFRLAKEIRKESAVPIIFLTAREAESDRITGFELGGDDYMVKPFSPRELVLRVKAVLKRGGAPEEQSGGSNSLLQRTLGSSTLVLDEEAHRVEVDGKVLTLTGTEWRILYYLANNPGILISREKILGECLDYRVEGYERTVDTHIKNIRAKLGAALWIETVRGFGYRFAAEAATKR
jgi:DNA-binding response OmpR family regulator